MTEKAARIDEDVALKASDVRENAGLSYRQLTTGNLAVHYLRMMTEVQVGVITHRVKYLSSWL